MLTQTLDFALQTKAIDESGEIEGLAAGYGNEDHGGDIIVPGAITKSLLGRSSVPMLLFHDQKRPVGVWRSFRETEPGLVAKGRFSMSTSAGKEAHALVSDGALGGLSIGYTPLKHHMVGKARELREIALHEVSLVSIPMNERTIVTSVKAILEAGERPTVREFEDFLRDAGGFSKSLATAIASKAAPILRGEPDEKAIEPTDFFEALVRKLKAG